MTTTLFLPRYTCFRQSQLLALETKTVDLKKEHFLTKILNSCRSSAGELALCHKNPWKLCSHLKNSRWVSQRRSNLILSLLLASGFASGWKSIPLDHAHLQKVNSFHVNWVTQLLNITTFFYNFVTPRVT